MILFLLFFLFKCSIRKWTGSNKLNSILVTRAFLIFTIWGWFELALWSIIWLTVYSLICKNNIFVVLDAFKVPPCIYIDMHLKGGWKHAKKNPTKKSTKWNNILIRLEHALRSLTTRTPLKTPFNRHESSSKSLSTSRVCTAVFKTEIKKTMIHRRSNCRMFHRRNTIWANKKRSVEMSRWTWIRKSFV